MRISAADVRWMRLALQQAERGAHHRWRVGALLVRRGAVLASGVNRYRNNPEHVHPLHVSYHAEEVVLRRTPSPEGSTLYVARVTRSGMLGLARPCPVCAALLADSGVHSVVWTDESGLVRARVRDLFDT